MDRQIPSGPRSRHVPPELGDGEGSGPGDWLAEAAGVGGGVGPGTGLDACGEEAFPSPENKT